MVDQSTMAKAMNGDRRAFGDVVSTCGPRLVRFAVAMVGDREAGRDIVQNAFVALWLARSTYRESGTPRSFLMRVVRNACIDYLRSDKGQNDVALDEGIDLPSESCEVKVIDGVLRDAIDAAVCKLPKSQRTVFVLSEYEGLSYQEIADLLGCPPGTVASRKHAAMESLRRRLRSWPM